MSVMMFRFHFPLLHSFYSSSSVIAWNAKTLLNTAYSTDLTIGCTSDRPDLSNQHAALLSLERRGENVFYAAPHFHTTPELNVAYFTHTVVERSAFFPPAIIGPLPDPYDHYLAFSYTAVYFCSEPKKLDYDFSGVSHVEHFLALAQRAESKADKRFFLDLLDKMAATLSEESKFPQHLGHLHDRRFREELSRAEAARIAAFTAWSCFDAELLLLGYKPDHRSRKRHR
jgi:hypothetical protein